MIERLTDLRQLTPAMPMPAGFRAPTGAGGAAFDATLSGALATAGCVAAEACSAVETSADERQRDARRRDRAARRSGHELLDGLAALQCALVSGGDPLADTDRLAGMIANMPDAADPGLAQVLRAVVLRARIALHRSD